MRFFLEFLWLAPNVTTSGLIEGGREKFYCRRGEEDAVAVQSLRGALGRWDKGSQSKGCWRSPHKRKTQGNQFLS
jgi:hypothetical protein